MSTDATQVTGSSVAEGAPRPGDVLAERYELLEVVDSDGPVVSYRALDQESERPVLVRVLAGDVMSSGDTDAVLTRLRGLVGLGGRYLGSLLDADKERGMPFTVEAWPRGTQLSAIIASRRGRGEGLGAQETLPVVAQLAAALAALPDPLCHGDVRAERVWLDTDGLRLTGAHLLPALSALALRDRVAELGPGAVAYAPEASRGELSPASDRWGVASIAWEALTGRSPDPKAASPEVAGALRDALTGLLSERPADRPADLKPLIAALAAKAKLAIPRIDPEAYRPPTAELPARKRPSSIPVVPRPRKIPGAAEGGTQEVSLDQIIEEEESRPPKPKKRREISVDSLDPRLVRAALGVDLDSEDETSEPPSGDDADDTAKHDAISVEDAVLATAPRSRGPDSLDPRLVRAALDVELDSEEPASPLPSAAAKPREPSIDGLDPRLVRAALGVTLDDSEESGIEELDSDLIEEEPDSEESPLAAVAKAPPARSLPARPPGAAPPSGSPRPFPGPKPSFGDATPAPRAPAPNRPAPAPSPPKPAPAVRAPAPPFPAASAAVAPSGPASGVAGAAPSGPPGGRPGPVAAPPMSAPPMSAPPVAAPPAPLPAATPTTPAPVARTPDAPPAAALPSAPPPLSAPPAPHAGPSAGPADASTPTSNALGPGHARPIQAPEPSPMSTSTSAPKSRPPRAASSGSITGVVIVLVAMIVAVLIIGVGFLIASHRRSEATRQRELDQRWEQIQQQQHDTQGP